MNIVFYHLALMGSGIDIAKEVVGQIVDSGLYDNIEKLYISVVGKGKDQLKEIKGSLEKISIVYHGVPVTEYEYPSMKLIEDFSVANDCNLIYLTGLGTTGRTTERENKRNYINYFLIDKWQDCVYWLEQGWDCVGVDFREDPKRHFTGFQYWTKSSYFRTLPKVIELNTEKYPPIFTPRHQAEFLIGYSKDMKVKSLNKSFHTDSSGKHTFYFDSPDWAERFEKIKNSYSLLIGG